MMYRFVAMNVEGMGAGTFLATEVGDRPKGGYGAWCLSFLVSQAAASIGLETLLGCYSFAKVQGYERYDKCENGQGERNGQSEKFKSSR